MIFEVRLNIFSRDGAERSKHQPAAAGRLPGLWFIAR